MSTQDGPDWYPSQHFVHSPPTPPGAPSSAGLRPDQPRWTQPHLVLWVVSAIASGVSALSCAVVTIVNAQNLDRVGSVGGIDPHSLGSACDRVAQRTLRRR